MDGSSPHAWRGDRVAAAVLAGGLGRRFGADKALAEVAGARLLDRAWAATAGLGPRWIVAGSQDRAAALATVAPPDAPVVPDDLPGHGPIGGLATALRLAGHGWVAVLAVDLPLLGLDWWAALRAAAAALAPDGRPAAVAGRDADGRWEPLAALYRADLAAPAAEAARLDPSLQRFLDRVGALAVPPDRLPAARSLLNVNTPADAATASRGRGRGEPRRNA